MGRPFRRLLSGKVYACKACRTHLSAADAVVSRHFHSRTGRAYLFSTVCNVVGGPQEQRMMTTGRHLVCDIFCAECMALVGWQYVFAYEESQKYKEGMCILERALVVDFDKTSPGLARLSGGSSGGGSSSAGGDGGSSGSGGGLRMLLVPPHDALALRGYGEDESGSEEEEEEDEEEDGGGGQAVGP